ncbi:MAG: GNAT family N-acetyltransferase [Gammaproteobacteria bacterium]|nr:MAG: GNAT family N-acetyltransferase [Gammaproteobacteria bacterium]
MLTIFRAGKKDKANIAELFDQYRIFYQMKSDIKSSSKFIDDRLNLNDSIIYLAKYVNSHSSKACGFIQIYPTFSSIAMKSIWTLNDLFVNQDYRKKGCARALMKQVEIDAKKSNVFSIKLATAIDNSQAKKLYESLNYKKTDLYDHYSLRI